MEIKFRKEGIVTVGTADPNQSINMENPVGLVRSFTIDMVAERTIMTVEAMDELNQVSRDFKIELTHAAYQSLLINFFAAHVQPAARAQYDEFKDLIQVQ